ncbi:Phosphatidylglycerol/phosphatidylinositol transfer protein [Clonorchis sinensis]|uniref:Phosphatidylglycerol/phosphatidylinositol transfer protein n=1 Tax=Clonorchis sinensis TaxID=79923 RepID=A0A8T1LVJ5_CLOSI|nr:Phosphatidylglycerol/phosphatidylinositol transfer protein [Clonorchis sinensis]
MQIFNLLVCSLVLYTPFLASATKFKDCGSKNVTVWSVKLTPCNGHPCSLIKGKDASIDIDFMAEQGIEPGNPSVQGKIGEVYMPLPLPVGDMCQNLAPSCPIQAGKNYTYRYMIEVSDTYPSIRLDIRWQLQDKNGATFLCVEYPAQLTASES